DLKINQFSYSVEVLPIFILMPTVGSRAALWQEIDGKVRTTPGRMIAPLFYFEDLDDCITSLTGSFRWEMCKREQGGRWNDVRDPSLTSKYNDYLQFYRKNRDISPELRERIKQDLQRARNNFRNMFVMDYMLYIKYESTGAQRMNKIARDILFEFCPFARPIRDRMASSPQYGKLIERHNLKTATKLRPLNTIVQKLAGAEEIPSEITEEIKFTKA
ncbi:MAG: cyclic nucleotide-binding domain-containing protein, partial [Lachnospiraceae bacterium]|nr:cyclic nucleotide-binding domain-containing protein [Lachnospiraceae bacterium]